MLDLIPCPAPDCVLPATVRERRAIEAVGGPVEHVRTDCPAGHWFNMPADALGTYGEPAEEYSILAGGPRYTDDLAVADWRYVVESAGLEIVGTPTPFKVNHPSGVPTFRVRGYARRPV